MGADELREEDFGEERIAALRHEVAGKMASLQLTAQALAREAEVGFSTAQAWMKGVYNGNNAAVAIKLARWLTSSEARSRTQMAMRAAPDFVWTPSARAFVAVMEHAQFAPDLSVVSGAPGVGKTTTVRQYARHHASVWTLTAEPVFGGPRALLEDLAEAVGVPALGSSGQRVSKAIVRKIERSGGLIVVDEAQHLTSITLDQLRTLHDLSGIGVVLVGNPTMFSRLEGGGHRAQFAQLYSRVGMRVARPSAQRGDVDALLDAWGIEERGMRQLCHAVARRGGALRAMTKVLRQAYLRADGASVALAEQHVLDAAQQLGAAPELEATA